MTHTLFLFITITEISHFSYCDVQQLLHIDIMFLRRLQHHVELHSTQQFSIVVVYALLRHAQWSKYVVVEHRAKQRRTVVQNVQNLFCTQYL